jgi:hypothetical protein
VSPPDNWQERFKGAHNATDYPRWVAAAETYAIHGSAISRCHSRAARILRAAVSQHMAALGTTY